MSSITLRFVTEAGDVGPDGAVHGSTVMKWIDQAGYACASAWAVGPCIMVYCSSVRFRRVVRRGDLVEVQARLAFTGQTNMNIAVELHSGQVTSAAGLQHTADALVVYVAMDEQGQAVRVTQWNPETPGEMALASSARAQYESTRPAPLE